MANTKMPGSTNGAHLSHRHLWIVTGPAGSGKTTVAEYLANKLHFPYLEGDTFHTEANVKKMASGQPLNDADRWDWLILLRQQSVKALDTGVPAVILTCSALKRKYRDVMRIASYNDHKVLVHFVYLHAAPEVLLQRVAARTDHYMKADMVRSQLVSLEEPKDDESDVLQIDVSGDFATVHRLALQLVQGTMAQDAVV